MPKYKFKIYWTEDDNIQRDIVLNSSHNFYLLHECLLGAFKVANETAGKFYASNEDWALGTCLCTLVEKNIKGAEALSCIKTPIGALVKEPNQRFVYVIQNEKKWQFNLELIIIDQEDLELHKPTVTRIEGISPSELLRKGKESIVETEERFDLGDKDGYGDEGEDADDGMNEDGTVADDGFEADFMEDSY